MVLVVLVGLSLITAGFVKETGHDLKGTLSNIQEKAKDITGKLIGSAPQLSENVKREIKVYAEFETPKFDLTNTKVDFVLKYTPSKQDYDILVGGNKLSLENSATLNIFGYSGDFKVDKYLMLSGNAEKIKINGVSFEMTKNTIPIDARLLKFDNIEINNLNKNINIDNVKGKVTVQDKFSAEIDNEPLEFQSFLGNVKITPTNMTFDGRVKRFFISGKDYSATVSG